MCLFCLRLWSLSCVMFLKVALIGNFWNRSPFLSPKNAHIGVQYEGSPVITPPLSRRRMTPPTPVQNSYTSFVRDHGRYEEERRVWNARERTIITRTKQFLERSRSVKVQVEALEALLGQKDVYVDLKRILKEARDEQGRKISETFSVVEPVLFCSFLRLDTDLRPTNQHRRVSFASIHLPRKSSWLHCDAFQSNSPSLFYAKEPELVRSILLPSALHACALLSISSSRLNGPFAPASF